MPKATIAAARRRRAAGPSHGPGRGSRHRRDGRWPSRCANAGRTVADHAVQRVQRLVGQHAGQAEQRAPEQRRYHAVGQVLRQRFQRGATDGGASRHSGSRPTIRETATRPASRPAQSVADIPNVIDQATLRQERAHQGPLDRTSRTARGSAGSRSRRRWRWRFPRRSARWPRRRAAADGPTNRGGRKRHRAGRCRSRSTSRDAAPTGTAKRARRPRRRAVAPTAAPQASARCSRAQN